jgi:hypothetical protein
MKMTYKHYNMQKPFYLPFNQLLLGFFMNSFSREPIQKKNLTGKFSHTLPIYS